MTTATRQAGEAEPLRILGLLAGAAAGGAETFFVTLFAALRRPGVEPRAVLRRNPERAAALRGAGVPCVEAPFGWPLDLWTPIVLAGETRRFRPHVVLAFMNRAAARMPAGPHLKVGRLGGYYDLKYYRRCDHLVCITEDIRAHVIAGGWPADRAHYLPNFAEADDGAPADRAAYGTPAAAPLVFAAARLHVAKALDVLLRAVATLDGVHLWIAGEGPERAALTALAAELGIAGRVRFLGWQGRLGPYYRAADVVAFPSRHEPFGTVTLEAWAYRRPLVVSDASGPAATVRAGVDALVVPREDTSALAAALRRLIEEPALAASLVAAGAARHAESFTREACVGAYLALFRRLLGREDGSAAA